MSGTPWFVALFSASLVGFLSFAGYEAVLAIRDLASADRGVASAVMSRSAVFGGVFFIVATAIEVLAFSALKLGSPQTSSNLLVDIAGTTLGTWSEVIMVIVTGLSALACCQVALISCARIIGAMAKDFAKPQAFVPTARGAAKIRLVGSLLAAVALLAVLPVCIGVEPRAVFELAANVGTLLLLVSYGIACWLASRVQQPESAKAAQRIVSYSGLALVVIVFASFLISVL
jgi:amino acid transporter